MKGIRIAGADHRLDTLFARLPGESAQQVVRLKPLHAKCRYTKSLGQLARALDLRAKVIGESRAGGFVFRKIIVAETAPDIKRRGDIVRLFFP